MKFNELAGDARVLPLHAASFISGWFSRDDKLVLVGMKSDEQRGPRRNVMSQLVVAHEFVEQLRADDGEALLESLSTSPDGTKWNLYVSIAAVEDMESVSRRGGIDKIESVHGVYVDLDVKSRSFTDQAQIFRWLKILPQPTLVTASGSGGIHAYWKCKEPLKADEASELQRAWWAYLDEKSGPIFIDYLVDASRVMRLPGSMRWPKKDEDIPARVSTVLHRDLSVQYDASYLRELSAEAAVRRAEKVRSTRVQDAQRKLDATQLRDLASGEGEWARRAAIANAEDRFAELMTWDEILCPAGWTYLREDREHRREFARPGSTSKSAVVDWPDSPDVMSLHSWSPDTNLADLKEANIVLTKWRVALRLLWNDDYNALLNWTLENG